MTTQKKPRLTLASLNKAYPDFQVEKCKSGYGVTHKPSGKISVCIISTLETAKNFIDRTYEFDWYLNNRSNYRLPNE